MGIRIMRQRYSFSWEISISDEIKYSKVVVLLDWFLAGNCVSSQWIFI